MGIIRTLRKSRVRRFPVRLLVDRLESRCVPALLSWSGGETGNGSDWFNSDNWFEHQVPGPMDVALIADTGTNPVIVIAGDATVQAILVTSARPLSLTGGNLTLDGSGNNGSSMNLQLNGGELILLDGAILGSPTTRVSGEGAVTVNDGTAASPVRFSAGSIFDVPVVNHGVLSVEGVFFNDGLTNAADGDLSLESGSSHLDSTSSNVGTMSLGTESTLSIDSHLFTNSGSFTATATGFNPSATTRIDLLTLSSGFANTGSMTVNQNLSFQGIGTLTSNGPIAVAANKGLSVMNQVFNYQGGTIGGSGTLSLGQGPPTSMDRLTLLSDLSLPAAMSVAASRLIVEGAGTLSVGGATTLFNTTFNVPILNAGTLTVLSQGTASLNAGFTNAVTGVIKLNQAGGTPPSFSTLSMAADSTNAGEILFATGLLAVNAGTLINTGTVRTVSGTQDRILLAGPLGRFDNRGTISVSGDDLAVTDAGTFSSSGSIDIGAGRTLALSNFVTFNYLGGALTGNGSLSLDYTTLRLNSDFTVPGSTAFVSNSTSIYGPGTFAVGVGAQATINAEFRTPFVNNGTTSSVSGMQFDDQFTNAAGATINLGTPTSATTFSINMFLLGGGRNLGTINLSAPAAGSSTIRHAIGTFTNSGTINSASGTDNQYYINYSAHTINSGTFSANGTNLTITRELAQGSFQNIGTIQVGAGRTLTIAGMELDNSAGGKLTGAGTIIGNIFGAGTISPGTSPGILTINGNVSLGGLVAELNGTTAGTHHDQLTVSGTVAISGPLSVSVGYAAANGDSLTIIANDANDAITGTFAGLPEGATMLGSGQTFTISYVGGTGNDVVLTRTGAATLPTRIQGTLVNDGSGQRSRVTSLTVTFDRTVDFATTIAAAFTLTRNSDNSPVTFTAVANIANGQTVVTLNNFDGAATQFGSLADGRYTLTALASAISAGGLPLDGDGDSAPGGNFTFGDAQSLFRFYGDMNGDRRVDISDFGLFSLAYLTPANYNPALDFNNDGRIDIGDFGQFSVRYFTTLP